MTAYTAGNPAVTFGNWPSIWPSYGASCTTSNTGFTGQSAIATYTWNVRMPDGSVSVVEGGNAMEARASVESAERCRPAIGRKPREVIGVTSA